MACACRVGQPCCRLLGIAADDFVGEQDAGAQILCIGVAVICGDGQPSDGLLAVLADSFAAVILPAEEIGCVGVTLFGRHPVEDVCLLRVPISADALLVHTPEDSLCGWVIR